MRDKKRKGRREGSKMEEGEWGGETGRRLGGAPLVEKRGKREYQGGLKSDWAQQYNWGQTRNDRECQLRQKKVLQPVDRPRAFG